MAGMAQLEGLEQSPPRTDGTADCAAHWHGELLRSLARRMIAEHHIHECGASDAAFAQRKHAEHFRV